MSTRHLDLASSIKQARSIADAVLYEGYLLYPYRATSAKNQVRWQFGVLGPQGAADAGIGEDSSMWCDFLIRSSHPGATRLDVHLRFLQHQYRLVERAGGDSFTQVPEMTVGGHRWLSWEEAVDRELTVGPLSLAEITDRRSRTVTLPGGEEIEPVADDTGSTVGRLRRVRADLSATVTLRATEVGEDCYLVHLGVANDAAGRLDKSAAIAVSLIGTHVIVVAHDGDFLSPTDPPDDARRLTGGLERHRCWPVLAGPQGESRILLVTPIVVEDHAELAPQSAGALFDSTEIDEILTLRVLTMTDQEKAEARATDPKAAEIIDRCERLTTQQMTDLHGVLRNPHGVGSPMDSWPAEFGAPALDSYELPDALVFSTEAPWWDPAEDASVSPATDAVTIAGVRVAAGSLVRVQPNRRADAQDLFYAGMTARVTAVLNDVDGDIHVAVVLVADPAAEMHDWYGRYLYFAPDELVPIAPRDSDFLTREGEPS